MPMQIPQAFPTNTVKALRALIAVEKLGKQHDAMDVLFRAYWAEGLDLADPAVIERGLASVGLDGKALVAQTEQQELKDELRRITDLALKRGVFGVPTIFVGERSFWGNDRLEFVERELKAQR